MPRLPFSVQVALGEGFFVEAEVVAEFVEVGAADFFLEGRAGVPAFLENIFEIQNDLWWRTGIVGVFVPRGADEKSEDAGIESVIDQFFRGVILEADRNLPGRVAQFGGQAVEGLHYDTPCGLVMVHGRLSRLVARSRRRAPALVPAGCLPMAPW